MAENTTKKYFWIRLRDTFMTSDAVDFLMCQKNGSEYVVLYQMLCLKACNTGGELARQIGEVMIPFDAEKIQRDCKYFSIDTVHIALELYKKLSLVYLQDNGILKIADFDRMVGAETKWAEYKRVGRDKPKEIGQSPKLVQSKSKISPTNSPTNVHTDIEIDIEKDIYCVDSVVCNATVTHCNATKNLAIEIIDYLNSNCKTSYSCKTKETQRLINGRLAEGRTVADFKAVIDNRVKAWAGTEMEQYLRPSTLFRPANFENYLNAKEVPTAKGKAVDGFATTTYKEFD